MIIFAHSKCKRYENRKIQGVALPKKERNGQEWKSSHHGTHHGEQDYGAVLLQVVLHSIALESSCQPIGGQDNLQAGFDLSVDLAQHGGEFLGQRACERDKILRPRVDKLQPDRVQALTG